MLNILKSYVLKSCSCVCIFILTLYIASHKFIFGYCMRGRLRGEGDINTICAELDRQVVTIVYGCCKLCVAGIQRYFIFELNNTFICLSDLFNYLTILYSALLKNFICINAYKSALEMYGYFPFLERCIYGMYTALARCQDHMSCTYALC